MRNLKVTKVQAWHVRTKIGDVDHWVHVLGERKVLLHLNLGLQAELTKTEGDETRRRGRLPYRDDRALRWQDESTTQKIKDLNARIDAINTSVNTPVTVDALIKQTEPPFTDRVLKVRISSKFKLSSQLKVYERKTDPMDILDSYKNLMSFQENPKEIICKAFFATLKGSTRLWFRKLDSGNYRLVWRPKQALCSQFHELPS